MTHGTPASHRLPDELIIEVLRQREICTSSDLARCCLVSRQFLSTAQRELYHQISMNTFPARIDVPLHQLAPSFVSSLLLRTLAEHPQLAKEV